MRDADRRDESIAGLELAIDALIRDYRDRLADDRATRLALRTWYGYNRAACRGWLNGDLSRDETSLLLSETLHHMISVVAPALAKVRRD